MFCFKLICPKIILKNHTAVVTRNDKSQVILTEAKPAGRRLGNLLNSAEGEVA